jgi:ABC-type Fe3+ transport system substrate-binding protein
MDWERRRCLGLGLGAAAALIAGPAPLARAETMDALYAKAKREGSLVLYGGGPAEPYERWAKEFQERFPGVAMSVTGGYSNVLDLEIDKQIAEKRLAVDIAVFQTVQDFVAWKRKGALAFVKPEGFDAIAPSFREHDGAFTTFSVNTLSYAYNTRLVAAKDVPRSALDFLDSKFRGKIVTCYPADDDATLYVFATIVKKYGWGYMEKYMANRPNFIQGHLGVLKSVAAGDNVVTFDATLSTTGALKRQGQPIELAFATADPIPVFTTTAGIFKAAPHPNAARLYLNWYMAKAQQSRTGVFSPRMDVAPPEGMKPLFSYRLANHYREFVTNEREIVQLRRRFEAYSGPVVNQGGIR